MAQKRNQLIEYANSRIVSTPQTTTKTTTTTGSHSGGGASRGGTQPVQTVTATTASKPILNSNYGDAMSSILGNTGLAAKAAQGGLTYQDALNVKQDLNNYANSLPKTPSDTGVDLGSGGGNGGGGLSVSQMVSDPYSDIYSLYDKMYATQQDALNQQRAARLNALQANYNNARSQLDSSFASGETQMNENADRALREEFINNKLRQRDMAQYLNGQGVTGGAAESILANLYNTYGNNRNEIENNRMSQLKELLANYQGTLGDIENSYLRGMADADSDYSGSIADALTNYYSNRADLLKQNIANQYKAALSKAGSGSSGSGSTDTNMKNLVSTVKQFKSNPAYALQMLEEYGYTGDAANQILQQAGIVPAEATRAKALSGLNENVHQRILDDLDTVYQAAMSNNNPYINNMVNDRLQKLATQYGLTEAQARAILEELGL